MPKQSLDPRLTSLLESLRTRVRRYVVWDSVLAVAAVVLSAFWIGLALDYLPVQLGGTEMPRLARTLLLLVVAAIVVGIVAKMLIGRLSQPLPDDSLALLVERHHPELGGRLVTAVQLNEPDRTGDSHSADLLRHVHDEAAAAIDKVDPNRVFRWEPLMRKGMVAGPLALFALLFLVISPQSFARAASRLTLLSDEPWPRRAHLEMVGVELPVVSAADDETDVPELIEFTNQTIRLPKGSNGTLRIRAQADDAELPVVCTVYYRTDGGTRGQSNMRRVGRVVDGYQGFILDGPPLTGLSESMMISIRGLDDRLDDFRIEAVQPPALTGMNVTVRYPDYLRSGGGSEVDMETAYQSGLRLREGSDVTLVASSSVPLGKVDVRVRTDAGVVTGSSTRLSDDGRQLRLRLENFSTATTVSLVPRDVDGISAQAPYRYFLGVVLDEPPQLDIKLKGIGNAVTPIAKIPIEAIATDDYGVDHLTISISPTGDEVDQISASLSPELSREGEAEAELDLRELVRQGKLPELKPEGAVNLIGEATDRFDLNDQQHTTPSEVFRLQIVTPEDLLAIMQRRELGLRARLEQTIDETRNLRDTLDLLQRRSFAEPVSEQETERTRQEQVRRLRVQQSGLQANKTSDELAGIAEALDDILQEMINNRVDSVDRRERIGTGVRDPLRKIVTEPLPRLIRQISEIEKTVADPPVAIEKTVQAVRTAEDVLLQLTAVLDKMLDLESYNEILDIVREMIDDQDDLKDDTKKARKKSVQDLFN
ncbi:MAG: polyketide synthase [Rubripirellula sp.]